MARRLTDVGAGIDNESHPEDNDAAWHNLGCLRECSGTCKKGMFTSRECEGCGRVYHNVCLAKMGYALEGDACMIEGAWYCKPLASPASGSGTRPSRLASRKGRWGTTWR